MNKSDIEQLFQSSRGSAIATIETLTKVETSAKFKTVKILKHTTAKVIIYTSLLSATNAFLNQVKKTGSQIAENDPNKLKEYVLSPTYFVHDSNFHSLIQHRTSGQNYLWVNFVKTYQVEYTIDGQVASKTQVAEYLVPSARDKLLNPNPVTYNKTNDVMHMNQFRAIKLENILSLTARGQTIT